MMPETMFLAHWMPHMLDAGALCCSVLSRAVTLSLLRCGSPSDTLAHDLRMVTRVHDSVTPG